MISMQTPTDKPKPLRFSINDDQPLDELKSGQWWLWEVNAEMDDGTERMGTVQGASVDAGVFEESTWEEYE